MRRIKYHIERSRYRDKSDSLEDVRLAWSQIFRESSTFLENCEDLLSLCQPRQKYGKRNAGKVGANYQGETRKVDPVRVSQSSNPDDAD